MQYAVIISLTEWPPNCPDVNPVEYLWNYFLKKGSRSHAFTSASHSQLVNAIEELKNIPLVTTDNLVHI